MPKFRLITFNCFGGYAPQTRPRLLTLAAELNRRAVDMVCLQEVQANAHRHLLSRACQPQYPLSLYEAFVHAPKGGLLTLTAIANVETRFVLYRARGLWYTPAAMDWILHKGVLRTTVSLGSVPVTLFNTHLTANYTAKWSRSNVYARQEMAQLRQLAELVASEPPERLVIVAGDFNIPRGSWLEDEFLSLSGLTDPLYDDRTPTLHAPRGWPSRYNAPIDFALVRAPSLPNLQIREALCFDQEVRLVNGVTARLSDHDGIMLELAWDDA